MSPKEILVKGGRGAGQRGRRWNGRSTLTPSKGDAQQERLIKVTARTLQFPGRIPGAPECEGPEDADARPEHVVREARPLKARPHLSPAKADRRRGERGHRLHELCGRLQGRPGCGRDVSTASHAISSTCSAVDKKATYDRIKYWISKERLAGVKAEFYTVSGKLFKTADLRIRATPSTIDGSRRPSSRK